MFHGVDVVPTSSSVPTKIWFSGSSENITNECDFFFLTLQVGANLWCGLCCWET